MALTFVDEDELQMIDMGDGDWVKIPSRLSFGFVSEFEAIPGTDLEKTAGFIQKIIKAWSAKAADGNTAEITIENVKKLDVASLKHIMDFVIPLTQIEKKSSIPSV